MSKNINYYLTKNNRIIGYMIFCNNFYSKIILDDKNDNQLIENDTADITNFVL